MISLAAAVAVVVALVIFIALTAANANSGGNKTMADKIYVYLVLFATLMMVIGGSVSAFMAAADLVAPVPYYQSYEEFTNWKGERPSIDVNQKSPEYTSEELQSMYDNMVKSEAERQKNRAYNTLFKSFGWIIIPLPVFIYFQKRMLGKS